MPIHDLESAWCFMIVNDTLEGVLSSYCLFIFLDISIFSGHFFLGLDIWGLLSRISLLPIYILSIIMKILFPFEQIL